MVTRRSANKGINLAALVVSACSASASLQVQAGPAQEGKPTAAATIGNFERFRKQSDPWKILNDAQVKSGIKALMGNKDDNYWSCTQLVGEPTVEGNDLFLGACVRGLNGYMNSGLDINLATGKICVGYLDNDVFHIFGVNNEAEMPKQMKDFNHESLSDKKLSFDKADWTPIKKPSTQARGSTKPLNVSVLTGTYSRKGNRFEEATLLVKQLPGNKIRFQLSAANGGHTGEASGTDAIKNNVVRHNENEDGVITMKFNGNKVEITGRDSYFCGMGVSLLGTYIKSDDKAPTFSD